MLAALQLHPDSVCAAVERIEVEALRGPAGSLALTYVVHGAIGDIMFPARAAHDRADGLWKHTCFEAFIGLARGQSYRELNVAPSTQWAAYAFSGYRQGMRADLTISAPRLDVGQSDERYELRATFALSELPANESWRLALSTIIEEVGGAKSYWALAHPLGRPDFHHADGFVLKLPAAERA